MKRARQSIGTRAAITALAVAVLCLILVPFAPWLVKYPQDWTIPAIQWIGDGLGVFLTTIKPAARVFSGLLDYPMAAANWLLTSAPWPLVIGAVTALGWYIGGAGMAALGFVGLSLVLASGYWVESMVTLALVFVSVPLALIMGLAIGILAYENARWKRAIQALLDVMQTVPTFAYLTPLLLLFGFGPVVGLIASAIYAAPPMARNVLLGLERVDPEIKEAAIMSGGTRRQQLFLIELPVATTQIMVGVNQCLMAALSMVIIAAVIGGFNDIGWEVLLTMRKAQFGQAFLAGLVIVVFAIVIDRMSARLALGRRHGGGQIALGILALGALISLAVTLPAPGNFALFDPAANTLDRAVGDFTARNGVALDQIKNGAMFYLLLPLRIGLDGAVLPFTWGFQWTPTYSAVFYAVFAALAGGLALRGHVAGGAGLMIAAIVLETGVSQLPWPMVVIGGGALGWAAGGRRLGLLVAALLVGILISGLWDRALLSLYLAGASVFACAIVGGALGLLAALSRPAWVVLRPLCDMLQTIPLFVFLIPVLMFFQIGEFSAFLAIFAYAVVPMIRYTRHGLTTTPDDLVEAALSSGATPLQTLWNLRLPYAAPTILLGLNQTILYAFSMLVIAALIGTTDLGQSIFLALGQADIGLGIVAGASMAALAFIADRIVQGFASAQRAALAL